MAHRLPGAIDRHIGGRLHLKRLRTGLTRRELAERMGVHPSLIRDYERGTARIVVSRLSEISVALSVPIGWFFEDVPATADQAFEEGSEALTRFLETSEALAIIRDWPDVASRQRQELSELIRLLARDARRRRWDVTRS